MSISVVGAKSTNVPVQRSNIADVVMIARNGLPCAKGIVVGALKCVVNAFGKVFEFVVIAIELAIFIG